MISNFEIQNDLLIKLNSKENQTPENILKCGLINFDELSFHISFSCRSLLHSLSGEVSLVALTNFLHKCSIRFVRF